MKSQNKCITYSEYHYHPLLLLHTNLMRTSRRGVLGSDLTKATEEDLKLHEVTTIWNNWFL